MSDTIFLDLAPGVQIALCDEGLPETYLAVIRIEPGTVYTGESIPEPYLHGKIIQATLRQIRDRFGKDAFPHTISHGTQDHVILCAGRYWNAGGTGASINELKNFKLVGFSCPQTKPEEPTTL